MKTYEIKLFVCLFLFALLAGIAISLILSAHLKTPDRPQIPETVQKAGREPLKAQSGGVIR